MPDIIKSMSTIKRKKVTGISPRDTEPGRKYRGIVQEKDISLE